MAKRSRLTSSQAARLSEAVSAYLAEHQAADDFHDALRRGGLFFAEVSLPHSGRNFTPPWGVDFESSRSAPALWLGWTVDSGVLNAVFAQKNACFSLPRGRMADMVAAIVAELERQAEMRRCRAVQFCGRYGWQRFAADFGFYPNGRRSPRGFPLFVKAM